MELMTSSEAALVPINKLEAVLRDPGRRIEIENAMPFDEPRTVRAAMQQLIDFARNQEGLVAQCDDKSKFDCCLIAARLGLQLNTPAHHVAVVPFKTKGGGYKATAIIEYRGLVALMKRYANVKVLRTEVVRSGDEYSRDQDDFTHKWDCFLPRESRGSVLGVYAIVETHDGARYIETMSVEQVEHVRAKSRSSSNGPWVTDWEQMARKTALRRASNLLDWSPKGSELVGLADKTEFTFDPTGTIEVKGQKPKSKKGSQAVLETLQGVEPEADVEPQQEAPDAAEAKPEPPVGVDPETGEVLPPLPKPDASAALHLAEASAALHLFEAQAICKTYGLPAWQRFSSSRNKLVAERAKELGLATGAEFWAKVREAFRSLTPEYYSNWSDAVSLDVLLRVPKRGNPDHFTKLLEGKPTTSVHAPLRTEGAPPTSSTLLELMGGA